MLPGPPFEKPLETARLSQINIDNTNDYQAILDGLTTHHSEEVSPGIEGFVVSNGRRNNQPIPSSQDFNVVLETLEDATKTKEMTDIWWACITIAVMSGTVGPDDFDDFSEFEFEKEAYEQRRY